MADKLGPGSYNGTQLAIDLMILEMNDVECQRLTNSESKRLSQKHSSSLISDIQAKYEPEIKQIRNDMRNSDDKTSDEYFELMTELEELEEERDAKIKVVEEEAKDKESMYDIQDTTLTTRYDALKADKEGLEDVQKSDIQRS